MKKSNLNFAIDVVTLLLMLLMICTGLIVRYVLPPGSGGHDGGPGLFLFGMSRHGWGAVHFWLAIAVVAALVLHVALHWSWVCTVTQRLLSRAAPGRKLSPRQQVAYGVGLSAALLVLVAGLVMLANSLVEERPGRSHGELWAQPHAAEVIVPARD